LHVWVQHICISWAYLNGSDCSTALQETTTNFSTRYQLLGERRACVVTAGLGSLD
jgi:hypothetical protein